MDGISSPTLPVQTADSAPTAWPSGHTVRLLALAVVAIGVAWRLTRYLLRFPIWGDEAMLLINYPGHSFADLAGPLEFCQVAPLLFHWSELLCLRLFGTGELAVRLPPLLASVGSLGLFAWLARMVLPQRARLVALAILAVSIWPATMGSLVKPYTFDLFFSLLLLSFAAAWRRNPQRLGWLIALTVAVPVALAASYPSVFVAGAISLALLPLVYRQKRPAVWTTYVLFNALLLTTFAGHYLLVGRAQIHSQALGSDATTGEFMKEYWQHGFPPRQPLALLLWLLSAHTGQMAAYPVGDKAGGSIVTVLLSLVGAWRLWRSDRWLLGLFASIFGLGLIAAIMRAYPYGASCRLAQHVAPVYCLLAGLGVAILLANRPKAFAAVLVVFGLVGAAGIARDVTKPYRDDDARAAGPLIDMLEERAGGDTIVGMTSAPEALFRWHLARRGDRVVWLDEDDPLPSDSVWLIIDKIIYPLHPPQGWRCVQSESFRLPGTRAKPEGRHFTIEHWVREEAE